MREAWVITDGAAGNERQALALAQAMDVPARALALPLRKPWAWFAPRELPGGRLALGVRDRDAFAPPWPRLAIGCGRSAALLTRLLRELSDRECFCVQILDPRVDPRHWDAVVAPRHDGLHGVNVIETLGSLNPVDDAWLANGRTAFAEFEHLPQPRTAVLLGGPRRGIAFDEAFLRGLIVGISQRLQRDGGSVLATASRRTPPEFARRLHEALAHYPGTFWSKEADGPNPYPGLLAWADRIIVTPDSVNMLSEAAAVGVPVHTLAPATLPDKLARFHAALRERGLLHDLEAQVERNASPPLRETVQVAQWLRGKIESGVACHAQDFGSG